MTTSSMHGKVVVECPLRRRALTILGNLWPTVARGGDHGRPVRRDSANGDPALSTNALATSRPVRAIRDAWWLLEHDSERSRTALDGRVNLLRWRERTLGPPLGHGADLVCVGWSMPLSRCSLATWGIRGYGQDLGGAPASWQGQGRE
jgi:hypothetical protein